ncbi:dimethylamine monooxygenase subunit DmmA family protein [Mesobacillus subterraneus]|uniref:Dimethylamine monooxygenase subunit DmmA-like C-terminal domain-containing protein n=1 Tax=Mesobacillus subterraneus TaxID=285983 RepID=A0A3R9FRY5_9BACI|nr:dimethylamine monooxygenase subunit DmmA family protein [Mesobacillus subterraneus]RSD22328.1 hypothetical protein EJA10_21500 [Mesobacillus subterraneus]
MSELSFIHGKRKLLFCADPEGAEVCHRLAAQARKENVPFEFHILKECDEAFVQQWFSMQKMGAYLYISGKGDFVEKVKVRAMEAGFSEHEMQTAIIGPVRKRLVCCTCHGMNEWDDQDEIVCAHCGQQLEGSTHYSRRLGGYLGYVSIK